MARYVSFPPMLLSLLGLAACAAPVPAEPGFADHIVEAPRGDEMFRDPELAINGVRGAGESMGSSDVLALRFGEHLIVRWEGRRVVDGPGPDFAVYENAFRFGDGLTFMDPMVVELSVDGERWVSFPHDYRAEDETTYAPRAALWEGFAGVTPVALHVEDNPLDPMSPAAGGDAFDLAALGESAEAEEIRGEGFAFLRLSPAADHENPDTGAPFVRDGLSDGPDIDGVYAANLVLDDR